jgi:hypothetical protein
MFKNISAPQHYVSVVLSGLKSGFGLLNAMVSKKIVIKLIDQNGKMIQTKRRLVSLLRTSPSLPLDVSVPYYMYSTDQDILKYGTDTK